MDADRRHRILFVVHSAKLAGAQLVALGQATALAEDHDLIIAVGHGPLRSRFAPLGSLVRASTRVPIWGASRGRWAVEIARSVPDAVRLAVLARRRGIDVIVVNSTVLVAPVLAGRMARIPVVVHVQEAPKSVAARRLFRFHGRVADTVVAISPWIAKAFQGARARVFINPVGIALPPREVRAARADGVALQVLVVGTIDAHKRQDIAIHALADLRHKGIDAVLSLVGAEADAEYARELRRLVADAGLDGVVRFEGSRSDVPAAMSSADVLLLPAGEVTPLVLMEAMACGTPVVAARMGGIPDIVVDGESGLLVAPDDHRAMAEATARITSDPVFAARLSQAGRRRVEMHFDEAVSHERLRAELDRLVAVRRAGRSSSHRWRRASPSRR